MSSSGVIFTAVFVILLIFGFAIGMSSIFKKLEAGEPVFTVNKKPKMVVQQESPATSMSNGFYYPILP